LPPDIHNLRDSYPIVKGFREGALKNLSLSWKFWTATQKIRWIVLNSILLLPVVCQSKKDSGKNGSPPNESFAPHNYGLDQDIPDVRNPISAAWR
jgi:hypothetical protein